QFMSHILQAQLITPAADAYLMPPRLVHCRHNWIAVPANQDVVLCQAKMGGCAFLPVAGDLPGDDVCIVQVPEAADCRLLVQAVSHGMYEGGEVAGQRCADQQCQVAANQYVCVNPDAPVVL